MIKGYFVSEGYMGYVDGAYMLLQMKRIIRNILESGIEIKLPQ